LGSGRAGSRCQGKTLVRGGASETGTGPGTYVALVDGEPCGIKRPVVRNEKTVERVGRLFDGGSIKLVYFSDRALTEDEYNEGVETLEVWARSYFG
jgi:hypothetical protein